MIEDIFQELEFLCADLCFAGLKNASPMQFKKMERLQNQLKILGMQEGVRRVEAFLAALTAYQRGECTCNAAADALCTLEFYYRHILEGVFENKRTNE